ERLQSGTGNMLSNIMTLDMKLEERESALKAAIADSAANLDQIMQTTTSAIAGRFGDSVGDIARAADSFGTRLDNTLAQMAERFDATGGRIESSINLLDTGLRDD